MFFRLSALVCDHAPNRGAHHFFINTFPHKIKKKSIMNVSVVSFFLPVIDSCSRNMNLGQPIEQHVSHVPYGGRMLL